MQPNLFDSFNFSIVENCTLCTVHWQTVLSQVLALRKRVVTEGDYASDLLGASKVNIQVPGLVSGPSPSLHFLICTS